MDSEYKPYSINVYPPVDIINKAFMDVMFFLNWTKVAIIYEEDQGSSIISFPPLMTGIYITKIHCNEENLSEAILGVWTFRFTTRRKNIHTSLN